MIKSVEEYLVLLKAELSGSDAATVQDALADAEEHLRVALANLSEIQPEMSEQEALEQVIEEFCFIFYLHLWAASCSAIPALCAGPGPA